MNLFYFNPHYKVKNRVYFSSFNFLAGGIKFMIKRRIIVNVSILFILVGCIIIVPRLFGMIGSKSLSGTDRKSTRLNSSHVAISYAVFCLKKKIHTDSNA